jgi:shikimate kinase
LPAAAALSSINIARLKESSVMVLLTASPDTVLKRTSADRDTRPVLMGAQDPAARIKELLKFRKPYYERSADIVINTSKLSLTEVADSIIEKLKNYEGFDLKK